MDLHETVLSEIFSWLPAKSIFKFKSCTKYINEFTDEKKFALKHAQNLMQKDDTSFFIQRRDINIGQRHKNYQTEIHALPGNKASSGIPTNSLRFLNERCVKILASSNGLLLCQIYRESTEKVELLICNPTTQLCSSIATPPNLDGNYYAPVLFGFECNNLDKGVHDEEFQLFLFEKEQNELFSKHFVCKVYMPKEGVWKEREKRLPIFDEMSWMYSSPVFYNGIIHFAPCWDGSIIRSWDPFIIGSDDYMSSCNVESGETRKVYLPQEVSELKSKLCFPYDDIRIFKWGKVGTSNESICLVSVLREVGYFTIWILIDYDSNSWSKLLTISLAEMGLKEKVVIGFTIMNGDSLVFSTARNMYRYDLIGERERRLERIGKQRFLSYFRFIPYSNTLRSCGVNAKDLSSFK